MLAMVARLDHLEDRVGATCLRREGRETSRPVVLVHAVVFGNQTLLDRPVRFNHALENQLRIRRHQQVDCSCRNDVDRCPEQASGAFQLVVAHSEIETGSKLDRRMGAERDRDLERPTSRGGAPGEKREMMVGCDAHQCAFLVQNGEAREGQVAASTLRVARQDHAGRDVGTGFTLEESRNRQAGERRVLEDDFLYSARCDADRSHGLADRPVDCGQYFADADAERGSDTCPSRQQIPDDLEARPGHALEQQCRTRVCGRQKGRQLVSGVDGLPDAQQLPLPLELGEERTNRLLVTD